MELPRAVSKTFAFTVLAVSLGVEALVVYEMRDPAFRLVLCGLILVAILWSTVWATRRPHVLGDVPSPPVTYRRRYLKLRSHVDLLMDSIRRLNWTVVDAEHGIRSRADLRRDANAIERRMHDLVHDIRESAGHPAPEAEELAARSE